MTDGVNTMRTEDCQGCEWLKRNQFGSDVCVNQDNIVAFTKYLLRGIELTPEELKIMSYESVDCFCVQECSIILGNLRLTESGKTRFVLTGGEYHGDSKKKLGVSRSGKVSQPLKDTPTPVQMKLL